MRTFLITAALAAMTTLPVHAESHQPAEGAGQADAATGAPVGGETPSAEDGPVTAEMLDGLRVIDGDGDRVGEISQILLTEDGRVDRVVVDVGGFLGLGERPVALPFADLELVGEDASAPREVRVSHTRDALEAMERWSE